MKPFFFVLLVLFVNIYISTAQTNEQFTIKGTVSNNFDDYIYLNYNDIVDSVQVKDNQFDFKGSVDYPVEALIRTKNGLVANPLYLENSDIKLTIKIEDNATYITEVEGSQTQKMSDKLTNFCETNYGNENFSAQLYVKLDSIITINPKSQFCGSILSEILSAPIFSYEEAMSLYTKIETATQQKESIESLVESIEKLKIMVPGKKFPYFELKGPDENMIRLDDYKGSILLVEFWSSWCEPCRKENPKLVEIYTNYQTKGFHILGISIDKEKEAWQKAIKEDQLKWTNTIVENEFDHPLLKSLKIQYIPSNYLLDKEGNILAVSVKPEQLNELLINALE